MLEELLDRAGATANRDVLLDILQTAVGLAGDGASRLNLKITAGALKEMRAAFKVFAPHEGVPKVTIFGSARTAPDDPLYAQARDVAQVLADAGWMVVTGAGPGIMAAGIEGAGRAKSIGVTIRLPFEEAPSELLAEDNVVAMKYFFTRKLMLIKESSGFVALPGGFGTQDEILELLTLLQTGKAQPAPLVLLDVPGGTYWTHWVGYVEEELVGKGLISPHDRELFLVTDDIAATCEDITTFWRNYHSLRWVGGRLVIRLRAAPSDEELNLLTEQFKDLLIRGRISRTDPLPPEVSSKDNLDLPRIVLRLDPRKVNRLRGLINALNRLPSAPS
jgi:hypothetical protein